MQIGTACIGSRSMRDPRQSSKNISFRSLLAAQRLSQCHGEALRQLRERTISARQPRRFPLDAATRRLLR
jgi:hypothetical protein